MKKTALIIMAAGIGSRFGTGIKQLATVDEHNHIIMDYSIHDAMEAGFDQIVFVIRREIEEEFKNIIGNRIADICAKHGVKVDYCFQDIRDIPAGADMPEGRGKPWGTGQAVLAAKELITTPFAVINADDYYGKEAYKTLHDYMISDAKDACMVGFVLKNTLSDNGGVTRGICKMQDNHLTSVRETKNIVKTENGAVSEGETIDIESLVSMNMWGFQPEFMDSLESGFKAFFEKDVKKDPLKGEFLIPTYVGELLQENVISVRVLRSNDNWYGMTYKEDVDSVRKSFKKLIEAGMYTEELF